MVTTVEGYVEGEEVIVRLDHARVFDPRRGTVVERKRTPPWTIARVVHASGVASKRAYVLAFRHRETDYFCAVDSSAIEGMA